MLIRHYSNRLEILADTLAGLLAEPAGPPLAPETVIVQSNGMARWLSLRLADRLGVSSNIRFPFPATFLWQMVRQTLGPLPETAGFDKPVLTWRVLGLLPALEQDELFRPLHHYLGAGDDDFRAYDLARRIADAYDQYLVYRPDWITDWEQGGDRGVNQDEQRWQPELWRRLVAAGGDHRVRLLHRFAERLRGAGPPVGLPPRLALIGLSALPRQQLELLALLADHCEVHLLLLNPCREYWGQIQAPRDIARHGPETDPADEYLEVGNPLLASLGKQARDFFDLLEDVDSRVDEVFVEPEGESLLAGLQADILDLRERGGENRDMLAPDDRSVQVHVGHSPTRELEVLHDQLLALFQCHPDLRPADVVVMTPDIDAYGPLIDAVFGSVERERYIPYSIADRGPGAERPLVEAVQQLIELARGRYAVDRVLGFLELDAVQRRFDLAPADLLLIRRWLRDTAVRWGIDAADRAALGLPATAEHSWRAGLERLLLGQALPGGGIRLWADILPFDAVEGSSAQVLGHLQAFAEGLFTLREEIVEPRPLADWAGLINDWMDRFFAPREQEAAELQDVRAALERLAGHAAQAGFEAPLPLTVVRAALNRALAEQAGAGGFFAGGVTFATMVPMRSIPFPVVCLIGMNHDSYPRPHRPADFDLMARDYRKGDRSRRQDDRYLFLEALLSARRCLYLSYVGRDIRDNAALPPSVLVSELLEVIEQGYYREDGVELRKQLVTEHPLQPFSPRYFDGCDARLFSYSQELAELGRRAAGERGVSAPFLAAELPPPEDDWRLLELDRLVRFFEHPVRFLLRERLKLRLEVEELALEGREPFALDGLSAYNLRRRLLALQLDDIDAARAHVLVRAEGWLPHGQVGANLFDAEWTGMTRFAARVRRLQKAAPCPPVEFDAERAGLRLRGWLHELTADGLVGYRPASIKPRDRLRLWLRHLLVNVRRPEGVAPVSRWLGLDGTLQLRPVADPERHLDDLLALYREGLQTPLALLPKTSWDYVKALHEGGKSDPMEQARKSWESNDHRSGEDCDPYLALAFRGCDEVLDETFQAVAVRFWRPFFEHAEETTG